MSLNTSFAGLHRYAPGYPLVNASIIDCPSVFLQEFRASILESDIGDELLLAQRLSCERVKRTCSEMSEDADPLVGNA